jgi:hypothetical protein
LAGESLEFAEKKRAVVRFYHGFIGNAGCESGSWIRRDLWL